MQANLQLKVLALCTAGAMALFTGNALLGSPASAPQPEEVSPETVLQEIQSTTAAATQPTLPPPDPRAEILRPAVEAMDGSHIFVYDLASSQMLAGKTGEEQMLYPASITKLYTLWLALEYLAPETVVTAGEELGLVRSGSSLAYIPRGSRLTVEMLAEGMLLASGNDASYVLAAAAGRAIAGEADLGGKAAVEAFVEEMNRMAGELGFVNSHFENPDGYHTDSHYSCPHDVALIGALAAGSQLICRYAMLPWDTVRYVSGENMTWHNTNRLVNPAAEEYVPQALGLKTGYTGRAGYCLLAAFAQGENRILVGIFGAAENLPRYENAAKLWQLCGG